MFTIPRTNEYAIAFLILMASFIGTSVVTLIGTFLPDLLCVMDTDLKSASFMFLSFGIGKCLMQFWEVVISDSVDWNFLTAIALGAISLSLLLIPSSAVLSVTVLLYCIIGVSTGIVEIARFYITGVVWKTSNVGYHFMSVGTGLGTVLTPLLASLFVNDNHQLLHQNTQQKNLSETICESKMYFPFSLLSLITVLTGLGFAINYYVLIRQGIGLEEPVQNKGSLSLSNRIFKVKCFHALLVIILLTITGCMTSVFSLMVTYGMRSGIHLDIQTSSAMTSVFGVCLLISRMFCTFVSDMVKPRTILWVCFITLTTASLNLLVFHDTSVIMLWVCSALHGLGAGPLFATVITWSRQYVTLSTRVVSVILLLSNVGNVIHSTLTGVLMDYFGPDMFVYTIASTRFLQLIVFCVLNLINYNI